MSYKALYRTYRPQTFEDVAGQSHVTITLKNAIKENRIAHAYLFAGPRGTGKTTIAKILAKAINCTGDQPPCNECPNCKAITQGDHPDVIEIDAASNNGVNEVRDLIDKVKYAPINAKYKVYIIDEVHMMTPEAFNALLKTLEEPPAHIVFILATTEPHKILPTIISRCQKFDFKRVDEKDIINRLEYVLKEEKVDYEEDALEIISKLADGGMRDALSILEQCLAYDRHLTVENINKVYGLLSNDEKIRLIKLLLTKDMKNVLKTLDHMMSLSIDLKRLTQDLIDVLKDVIIFKNTEDLSLLFVLHKNDIQKIVPYMLVEEAFQMIDIFMDASSHYGQAVDSSTYFELALLKICNQIENEHKEVVIEEPTIIEDVSHETLVEEKTEIVEKQKEEVKPIIEHQEAKETHEEEIKEEEKQAEVSEEKEPQPEKLPSQIEVDFNDILNILVQAKRTVLNDIQDKWPVIRRYCYNLNTAKYANMLCDAKPVAAGEKGFILTLKYQPEVNNVNYTENYYPLKSFLKEVLGSDYDFIAVMEDEWPHMRQKFIQLNKE
ncbi:MAG: DNA polymerase III subunit gamma/tau, partial [Coprobacillus sp.]|nr:DNA polymerase III subunit gamma/tau [Coprobacillus sp.]